MELEEFSFSFVLKSNHDSCTWRVNKSAKGRMGMKKFESKNFNKTFPYPRILCFSRSQSFLFDSGKISRNGFGFSTSSSMGTSNPIGSSRVRVLLPSQRPRQCPTEKRERDRKVVKSPLLSLSADNELSSFKLRWFILFLSWTFSDKSQ